MNSMKKRPYSKPAITVIPAGSPKYEELMQKLSQKEAGQKQSNQAPQSENKEAANV